MNSRNCRTCGADAQKFLTRRCEGCAEWTCEGCMEERGKRRITLRCPGCVEQRVRVPLRWICFSEAVHDYAEQGYHLGNGLPFRDRLVWLYWGWPIGEEVQEDREVVRRVAKNLKGAA